jgi:hypothetical protein
VPAIHLDQKQHVDAAPPNGQLDGVLPATEAINSLGVVDPKGGRTRFLPLTEIRTATPASAVPAAVTVTPEQLNGEGSRAPAAGLQGGKERSSVLIVDDNPINLKVGVFRIPNGLRRVE